MRLQFNDISVPGCLCYDDGCHFEEICMNTKRANQTVTAAHITSINIVIDKMHFRGHTDTWCKENCDPHKFKELDKVCNI